MHAPSALILGGLLAAGSMAAAPPAIPRTNAVVRYERLSPVFQAGELSRERGDALLAILDGGLSTEEWMKNGFPPGVACVLPPPLHTQLRLSLTSGKNYVICLSHDGGYLSLPEGPFVVTGVAEDKMARLMAVMEEDLMKEVQAAQTPCTYTVGTVNDGGTLSGIARLFYRDASQWRPIYESNRRTLKNPNVIEAGMKLTIPKLK